jgi:hypothetical protein
MSRTADKSTPQISEATGFPLPWDEALKRAGSFDKLQPRLHMRQILACHGGIYSWPNARQRSGPGYFKPEWWAHAYVQAGRLMFFIEEAMFGPPVQEHVFAYTSSIVLDSVAFDAFFRVAGLPPTEPASPSPQVEPEPESGTPARRGPPERYDWDEGFQFMRQELDTRGDPANPINAEEGWRSDADVARLVAAHIAIGDQQPDLKHTARTIRPQLAEWRAKQAERN